jgi:hypothetical protein
MYPLNLTKPTTDSLRVSAGFAVANDEAEHQALSAQGYEPKYAAPAVATDADPSEGDDAGHTVESVRAQLDAAGIPYSPRLGLKKLLALLQA